jgi:nuclear transport factor 2 (NTF2) superfamily protein
MLESVPISSFSCLLFHKSESRINEVGINSVDGKVSRLGYGLDNQWAQVAFLNKQEKAICLELLRTPYRRNYFGYELINEVVDMGGSFKAVGGKFPLVELDSGKNISEAVDLLKNNEIIE